LAAVYYVKDQLRMIDADWCLYEVGLRHELVYSSMYCCDPAAAQHHLVLLVGMGVQLSLQVDRPTSLRVLFLV